MGKFAEARAALGLQAGQSDKIPEGAANAVQAKGLAPHTLVFCEPEFLHEAHVPARVHVVGPCFTSDCTNVDEHILPWLQEAMDQGQKVVYVALGTLANGFLTATSVKALLDTFAGLGAHWRVLWSLPSAQQKLLSESGCQYDKSKVRVEDFVRQRAVLSHPAVRVFLTHGGQSSANEALAAALPVVCMPLFCDQYEVAEAIHRHGLGLVFHKDELVAGKATRLVTLLLRAAEEQTFRSTAQRYSHLMRLRQGCGRAAEVIESIIWAGADYQELWCGEPSAQALEESSPHVAAGGGA